MALDPSEELAFGEDDLAPVVAVLAERSAAGSGWVNFSPEVEPGAEPPPRNLFVAVLAARGDPVPLVTWTPPEAPGRRSLVGIQHGSGPRALQRLADRDLPLGAGWLKVSDHPRRGLVVTAPADADLEEVLRWLLSAARTLCPAPLTGSWLAKVYRA